MDARLTAGLVTGGAAAIVVAADQLSKHAVERRLHERESMPGPFGTTVRRVTNDRPIGGHSPLAGGLLIGAGALLAAGIAGTAIALHRPLLVQVGGGLVAGAMASNLYDRSARGHVTDFIASPLGTINVADAAIGAGIAAFALGLAVRR